MNRIVMCFLALLAAVVALAQHAVVSGTVSDATTGQAVAGASVSAGRLSVVTNADGFFTLKTDGTAPSLTVSHVGYQPQTLSIGTPDSQAGDKVRPLRVWLKPATIQLSEVLVMSDNARELMLKAIGRIPRNYSQRAELFRCFYRETAMKRQHYICVAEGVVDMYKTGYQHDTRRDRVAISKGRRLLSPKKSDTLSVKVLGGPVAPVVLDVVKNTGFLLNAEELDCYDLKLEVPTTIGGRSQWVVSIAPRRTMEYALYYGRFYIDQQTLAFTRAELSLDMSNREKATRLMLVRKPAGVRFKPKELSLLVDYSLDDDGLTRISYVRSTFRFNCDWKRRIFATSFTAYCEMVVTDKPGPNPSPEGTGSEAEPQPISGRDSFDQHDAFFDKVDYFRDPAFWQDYNIIEPTESLDKAVNRLLKKY